MFSRDNIEGKDIILILQVLPELSQNGQVFVPRSTANEKANTLKAKNEGDDGEDNHQKGEERFDDKKAAALPHETRQQVSFDE